MIFSRKIHKLFLIYLLCHEVRYHMNINCFEQILIYIFCHQDHFLINITHRTTPKRCVFPTELIKSTFKTSQKYSQANITVSSSSFIKRNSNFGKYLGTSVQLVKTSLQHQQNCLKLTLTKCWTTESMRTGFNSLCFLYSW